MTKIKVLLSNDDGISAPGLHTLLSALSSLKKYDIRVGAPETERSGCSHSISFTFSSICTHNGRYFDLPVDVPAYSVSGFPADSVKLPFLSDVFGDNWIPDIVLSGINRGANAGLTTYMSGTVAAAQEGVINGAKAMSISLRDLMAYQVPDYEMAIKYTLPVIEWFIEEKNWPLLTILNVNVPLLDKKSKDVNGDIQKQSLIKGLVSTTHEKGYGKVNLQIMNKENIINESKDGIKIEVKKYKMGMKFEYENNSIKEINEDDIVALRDGWMTLTPISLISNNGNEAAFACLKEWQSTLKHPLLSWFQSKL